jgi:hypothetical protein
MWRKDTGVSDLLKSDRRAPLEAGERQIAVVVVREGIRASVRKDGRMMLTIGELHMMQRNEALSLIAGALGAGDAPQPPAPPELPLTVFRHFPNATFSRSQREFFISKYDDRYTVLISQ